MGKSRAASMSTKERLKLYRSKRDFNTTAEPSGRDTAATPGFSFVIQKHAASRLHYDFRLEIDGVLRSWSVPKGPSLNPSEKRLAVETEDHPLEYGNFEGIIPKGQYGGGTVLIWDNGTWVPEIEPQFGYKKGHLKFQLMGHKLQGGWHLVRLRETRGGIGKNWLLMKQHDEAARPSDFDITVAEPNSVVSSRDIETIAADGDNVWHSKKNRRAEATPKRKPYAFAAKRYPLAKAQAMPKFVPPQLATLVDNPPRKDSDFVYEIKLDGYRIMCHLDHGDVTVYTRNGLDWTHKFSELVRALRVMPVKQAIIDGEVVALDSKGISNFGKLQDALANQRTAQLRLFGFDLLHINGYDLKKCPLVQRKAVLREIVPDDKDALIRYSEHLEVDGQAFLKQADALGLEGIIGKRLQSPYVSRRTDAWVKLKCHQRQEMVIGGYTEPAGSREDFGALLVGVYRDGDFVYAGRVGTGFDTTILRNVGKRLRMLEQSDSPFADLKKRERGVHWVRPELVCEVRFGNWTTAGVIRHAAFEGLREDKEALSVIREKATSPKTASELPRAVDAPKSKLTNPDRVLYPEGRVTKRDLAAYYEAVSSFMLPHLHDRPLMVKRCPDGYTKECFYQKHVNEDADAGIFTFPIPNDENQREGFYIQEARGLQALAQVSSLEIHIWGSRVSQLAKPDQLVFDLDPDESLAWSSIVLAAEDVWQFLQTLGLESFVKTTGGKGLHVVVPLLPVVNWSIAKDFARFVASAMTMQRPDTFIDVMSKARRKGKIFIDYLRNGEGATAIAPYSTRARPYAPVAMPLHWSQLREVKSGGEYNVKNALVHLERRNEDPWQDFHRIEQAITLGVLQALQHHEP